MAVIIQDYFSKQHVASVFSRPSVVTLVLIIITIALPMQLVTFTHNYWVNTAVYFEQPNVKHLNELLVFVYTDQKVYTFGSTKALNDLIDQTSQDSTALSPQFQVVNHDANGDGKPEQVEVSITMNTVGSKIRNIAILQTVVFSIQDKIDADLKVRFLNDFSTPNGVSSLSAQGSIHLEQKENFALGKLERQIGFEEVNDLAYMLRKESILSFMMGKYSKNATVDYEVDATYISTSQSDKEEEVKIDLLMDIPVNQQIRYTPNILDLYTTLWIQYISLLILTAYVIYFRILGSGFTEKILASTLRSEIKRPMITTGEKIKNKRFNF